MTFKTRGTINPNVTHLGHPGNLILLCARCHGSYSAPIPRWLIVPANEVLQQMIDQEDRDYAYREAQALKGVAIRRTLLQLDAKAVTYNAFILHEAIYRHMGQAYFNSACPRFYHGDVSAVFHRALTGAFHPWGTYDIQVYGSTVSVGVPASTQSLLSELAIKYGRKDPDVKLPLSVVLRHPPDKGSSQDQTSPDSTDASQSPNNGDDDMAGPSNGGGGGEFEAQYFEKSEVSSMATAFSAPSERRTSMEIQRFVFGPEFSANDIVKQAMGLYSYVPTYLPLTCLSVIN